MEVVVSFCLAVFLFAFSYRLVFTKKKSVEYSERIDDLRSMRQLSTQVTRDLATAARVVSPAWDTAAYELKLLDGEYRAVQYRLRDGEGKLLTTPEELAAARDLQVTRHVAGETKEDRFGQGTRLAELRFTRIGRDLVGMSLRFRPREGGRPDDPGLAYRGIVRTGRRVD